MRHRHLPYSGPKKLLIIGIIVLASPYIAVKVFAKLALRYLVYLVALVTPVEWNEEEEAMLRDAIARGYHPRKLKFTFWRPEKNIAAKAEEMGLITPETRKP